MVLNSLTLHLALNILRGLRVHSHFPDSNYANIWVSPFTTTVKGVRTVHIPNELLGTTGGPGGCAYVCLTKVVCCQSLIKMTETANSHFHALILPGTTITFTQNDHTLYHNTEQCSTLVAQGL